MLRTLRRPAFGVVAATTVALCVFPRAAAAMPADPPHFQLPFACGESWEGSTRASHSPSALAVDWNRDDHDEGHVVVATGPGVVTAVTDLGDTSYGRFVVVDHGGGWTTLHAHLLAAFVVVGQRVDTGQPLALLGNSGNTSGPHLHYEQRLNGVDQHAVFDDTSFDYDSWIRSHNCTDVPIVGEFDGDRLSDVGTFTHHFGGGLFRTEPPATALDATRLGLPTDAPVVGDWDGDGTFDPGVWRTTTHRFIMSTPGGGQTSLPFGHRGDLGLSGDWDGDGRFEVGVFRPSRHTFLLRRASGQVKKTVLGSAAAWPLTGDWNGDGRFDVGVYNPETTMFRLALADGSVRIIDFGRRQSLPVSGYWNGDARSDVGVWNPATGVFAQRYSAVRTEKIRFGHRR